MTLADCIKIIIWSLWVFAGGRFVCKTRANEDIESTPTHSHIYTTSLTCINWMLLLVSSIPEPPYCAVQSPKLQENLAMFWNLYKIFHFYRTALIVSFLVCHTRFQENGFLLPEETASVWTWELVFVWDAKKYYFSLLCFLTSFSLDAARCSWSKSVKKKKYAAWLDASFPKLKL